MKSPGRTPEHSGRILVSAARGSAILVAGRLAARAGSFFFFILMTRLFPLGVVGSFASAQAIGLILYAFLDYGLATLLTRDLAASGGSAESPITAAVRVRGISATISLGVAIAAAAAFSSRTSDLVLVWLAMLFDATAALLLTGARRDRRLGRIVAADMIRSWSAPAILCGAWLAMAPFGQSGAWNDRLPYVSFVAASAISFGFALFCQWPFVRGEWSRPAMQGLRYGREGLVVAAAAAAVGIHNRIDLILLKILDTPEAVASYAGAYALLNGAFILPVLYSYVLFPDLARLPAEGPALREVMERGARLLATVGSLAGAVLASAPEALLAAVFGATYARGGTALAVLAAAVPFVFVSNLSWNTLVGRKQEMRVLVYIAVAALLNAVMNALLIPRYSLSGAAAATLVAEVLVWVWSSLALVRSRLPAPSTQITIGTVAAALVPPVISLTIGTEVPQVFRAIGVLASWYVAVRLAGLVRAGELRSAFGLARWSDRS
jgi:O-antigen/teichoic acid export membrane protein